jgi:hypothetical protein
MMAVTMLIVQLLIPSGCNEPTKRNGTRLNPTETKPSLLDAETPRALLKRMYFAVENSDPAEFHACHQLEWGERGFLLDAFDYLVAQSHLRRAAIAAYGEETTATLETVRGGILEFDTYRFPEMAIEENGDTALARWTERQSEGQTSTCSVLLRRIDGRWFLSSTPAPKERGIPRHIRLSHRYWWDYQFTHRRYLARMVTATFRIDVMRALVEEVQSGSIKASELDEQVKNRSCMWKP